MKSAYLKKTLFASCFFLCVFFNLNAQLRIGAKFGYSYQRSSFLETSVILYNGFPFLDGFLGFYGLDVGSEFRVGGSKFIFAPKAALEMHAYFLGARFSAACFTDGRNKAMAISPEVGLSFLGAFYLMGGYSWTVSHRDFWDTTGPKISAGINFGYIRDLF